MAGGSDGLRQQASQRDPAKLLFAERGFAIESFVQRRTVVAGNPRFRRNAIGQANPNYYCIDFTNDGNAGNAVTAAYPIPYSTWSAALEDAGGYEDGHTVYIRVHNGTNDPKRWGAAVGGLMCGPATAVHDHPVFPGSLVGHCYGAWARYNGSVAVVSIALYFDGSLFLIGDSATGTVVRPGDVLGISYRWHTATSTAHLAGILNGDVVVTATSAGGYRMSTVAGRPGLMGFGLPVNPANRPWGTALSEWYVLSGWQTRGEIGSAYPSRTGQIKVAITTNAHHRINGGAQKLKWLFTKEIVDCSFSCKRIGGCATAQVEVQLQDWGPTGSVPPPPLISMYEPYSEDWRDEDWMGGELVISCDYSAIGTQLGLDEVLWRGAIVDTEFDRARRSVVIAAEGHIAFLERAIIERYNKQTTIREAVREIIETFAKKGDVEGKEFPIRGVNLTAVQSILDQRIDLDLTAQTVADAIRLITEVLPGLTGLGGAGMVWGVDRNGVFYLSQSVSHYDTGSTPGTLEHFPTFWADVGDELKRTASFDVTNDATFYGRETSENPEDIDRIKGTATCKKSVNIYGRRRVIQTENAVQEVGLAAKLAQAIAKRGASPELGVRFRAHVPIEGTTSFWHLLVPDQPHVAILDRRDPENTWVLRDVGETSPIDYKTYDKVLRRWGDLGGYAKKDAGNSGAVITFPASLSEQGLNKSWLLHLDLRFDTAHPGAGGQNCTVFGRQRVADRGWGSLIWANDGSGNLFWYVQTNAGARTMSTGIAVNPTTPGNAIVRLSVHRDVNGVFRFYNGTSLTGTEGAFASEIIVNHSDDWWFLDGQFETRGWTGAFENFWIFNDRSAGAGYPRVQTAAQAFVLISRNNNQRLHANEGAGVLRVVRFNEPHHLPDGKHAGLFWEDSTQRFVAHTYTWTKVTPSDATSILTTSRRGWRMGESSASQQAGQQSLKKWGGPLIMVVDTVIYRVLSRLGHVEIDLRAGSALENFAGSVAALKQQAMRTERILTRVREEL